MMTFYLSPFLLLPVAAFLIYALVFVGHRGRNFPPGEQLTIRIWHAEDTDKSEDRRHFRSSAICTSFQGKVLILSVSIYHLLLAKVLTL
jgi:hypothetical protein